MVHVTSTHSSRRHPYNIPLKTRADFSITPIWELGALVCIVGLSMPAPARGMTTASKTVAFATFPLRTHKQVNGLARDAGEQTFYFATGLLPFHCRIDRRRRLAVVLAEAMRVDAQGDCRRGMAQALADGRDVHPGVDQLRGVGVPQSMKRNLGHSNAGSEPPPQN